MKTDPDFDEPTGKAGVKYRFLGGPMSPTKLSVCKECGALVGDTSQHTYWHSQNPRE